MLFTYKNPKRDILKKGAKRSFSKKILFINFSKVDQFVCYNTESHFKLHCKFVCTKANLFDTCIDWGYTCQNMYRTAQQITSLISLDCTKLISSWHIRLHLNTYLKSSYHYYYYCHNINSHSRSLAHIPLALPPLLLSPSLPLRISLRFSTLSLIVSPK